MFTWTFPEDWHCYQSCCVWLRRWGCRRICSCEPWWIVSSLTAPDEGQCCPRHSSWQWCCRWWVRNHHCCCCCCCYDQQCFPPTLLSQPEHYQCQTSNIFHNSLQQLLLPALVTGHVSGSNIIITHLEHVGMLVSPGRTALTTAHGGVGGGAGQVVQVDRGGEHHGALPLHGLNGPLPSEPVPQLCSALVILITGVGAGVLVWVVGLQQSNMFSETITINKHCSTPLNQPSRLLQSVVSLWFVTNRNGHHDQTEYWQTTAHLSHSISWNIFQDYCSVK